VPGCGRPPARMRARGRTGLIGNEPRIAVRIYSRVRRNLPRRSGEVLTVFYPVPRFQVSTARSNRADLQFVAPGRAGQIHNTKPVAICRLRAQK
jgi:hypothetical protein